MAAGDENKKAQL